MDTMLALIASLQVISILSIIVPIAVAALAALVYIAIANAWKFQTFMAMFVFALCILLLPRLVSA